MTNLFIILIVISTVIVSIINFLKPAYKNFTGKFTVTVNVALSFTLWILWAFSVLPYIGLDFNAGMLVLIWLALGTWSNIWYDLREIVKWLWNKLNVEKKED